MSELPAWRQHYPFESHFLQVQGHRYHYLDEGSGEQPLLLVHGNPTWSFHWRNLLSHWRDRFRTIAPDHLGCGLSDKPQRYPYGLETHARNLLHLMDKLDLSDVTLVAQDWGGAIGLLAAVQVPDRFTRLILMNTGAFPPPRVPRRIAICRTPLLGSLAIRGLNAFVRAALRMTMQCPGNLSRAEREGILAPYNSWSNRVAIDEFVRDIPLTRRHPTYAVLQQLECRLAGLTEHPTLLIWGMRDWCFDRVCLQQLQLALPHARVHEIADAGHWVVEDAWPEIATVVDRFLQQTSTTNTHH